MNKPTYQGSSAAELIAFAKENGVDLPDDTNKSDAWKAVKAILTDLGETAQEETESSSQSEVNATQGAATKSKDPTHYTISVSKPSDTKLHDFTVNANGTNFQIHFGKKVQVPAVVLNILNDAVERKPAHQDMETNEWIEETFEHRYSFAIHQEHFE